MKTIMCLCVTCGHVRPFTGSEQCSECEKERIAALLKACRDRLESLEGPPNIVALDFQERKQIG